MRNEYEIMENVDWEEIMPNINWRDEKECLAAVKRDGFAFTFVKKQTHEMCLEAVKQCWYMLRFVEKQTPEIVALAIVRNGNAKQFVNIPWSKEIEREILFLTI